MVRLAVELYDVVVGALEGDARGFDFVPTPEGRAHFGSNSAVLSVTIPLVAQPRREQAGRRRNWFAELLPEGDQYDGLSHSDDGRVTLAPAYDVVPQAHMRNDGRLALAVGKKYRHADVTREDLRAELSSWGLRAAAAIVDSALEELGAVVASEAPLDGAFPALQEQVARFIGKLRRGDPVGDR